MAVALVRSYFGWTNPRESRFSASSLPSRRDTFSYSSSRGSSPGSSSSRDDLLEQNFGRSRSNSIHEKAVADSLSVNDHESTRVSPRLVSDVTIGLSDGLTVPFALTAGLSALGSTRIVLYGGMAELLAGAISMGLGGYLGAKSEAEAYHASLKETRALVNRRDDERVEFLIRQTFEDFDLAEDALRSIVQSLVQSPDQTSSFLMRFHHQLTEDDYAPRRAYISGLTIAMGYVCGGLVALLPYLFLQELHTALTASIVVMAFALFAFGWFKTSLVGETCRYKCFVNGVQMLVLGGIAAGAAMGCVKLVSS